MLSMLIGIALMMLTLIQVQIYSKPNDPIDLSKPIVLIQPQASLNKVLQTNIQPSVDQTTHRWLATSASFRFCHDPLLALSIMEVESNFNNTRAKHEPSTGLMQVKPSTARWMKCRAKNEQDLLNIELNIQCGCRYLAKIADTTKRLKDQIATYNAGAVKQCYTGKLYPSGKACPIGGYINQSYVDKVMSIMETKYGHIKNSMESKQRRLLYALK